MRREEEERRARFEAGATALYTRARDIALAAYDGDGAAEAMIVLAVTFTARTRRGSPNSRVRKLRRAPCRRQAAFYPPPRTPSTSHSTSMRRFPRADRAR